MNDPLFLDENILGEQVAINRSEVLFEAVVSCENFDCWCKIFITRERIELAPIPAKFFRLPFVARKCTAIPVSEFTHAEFKCSNDFTQKTVHLYWKAPNNHIYDLEFKRIPHFHPWFKIFQDIGLEVKSKIIDFKTIRGLLYDYFWTTYIILMFLVGLIIFSQAGLVYFLIYFAFMHLFTILLYVFLNWASTDS